MKVKLILTISITFLFLLSSLGGSLAPVSAQADGPDSAVLVETQADGRLVEGIGIGSPLSVEVAAQMDTAPLPKGGMIANFPAYKWVLGTSAAAAGMTSGSVRNLGGAVTGAVGVAGKVPVAANPGYTYTSPSTGVVNQSVTVLPAFNILSM